MAVTERQFDALHEKVIVQGNLLAKLEEKIPATIAEKLHDHVIAVGKIEGSLSTAKWFIGISVVVVVGFLGWGASAIVSLETEMANFGIGKTGQALNRAKTPAEVQKALTLISAKTAMIRGSNTAHDKQTLIALDDTSRSVQTAINEHPDYAQTWQAVSSLINLRSAIQNAAFIPPEVARFVNPRVDVGASCLKDRNFPAYQPDPVGPPPSGVVRGLEVYINDCYLVLDDLEGYHASDLYHRSQHSGNSVDETPLILNLVRVRILYHGGKLIPINSMRAYSCTFDFDIQKKPPQPGLQLLEALLKQDYKGNEVSATVGGV